MILRNKDIAILLGWTTQGVCKLLKRIGAPIKMQMNRWIIDTDDTDDFSRSFALQLKTGRKAIMTMSDLAKIIGKDPWTTLLMMRRIKLPLLGGKGAKYILLAHLKDLEDKMSKMAKNAREDYS